MASTAQTAFPTVLIPVRARKDKNSFYRPELDVLRFFAFFAVFLFHLSHSAEFYVEHGFPHLIAAAVSGLTQAGVFGVDLFFVLSAYLITELLLREKSARGTLDVPAFYLRRALRIWPLYFFYIGIALIPALNPNHAFSWRHVTAFLLLAGNWSVIAYGWPLHSIVGPLWTVSIEEQFYLVWPPMVRSLSGARIAWAAIGMLFISSATRIAMVALHGGQNSVWCNTLGRLDPIAAGILVAAGLRGNLPKFGLMARLAMLCAGVFSLTLVARYWPINAPEKLEWAPTLLGYPAVAASCLLVMLAALGSSFRMPSYLVYLGKISYGLYVFHPLGNVLSNRLIPVHTAFLQLALRPLAALACTIILAAISYAVLEKPFLKLKQRFSHVDSRPV